MRWTILLIKNFVGTAIVKAYFQHFFFPSNKKANTNHFANLNFLYNCVLLLVIYHLSHHCELQFAIATDLYAIDNLKTDSSSDFQNSHYHTMISFFSQEFFESKMFNSKKTYILFHYVCNDLSGVFSSSIKRTWITKRDEAEN